jgi:hypothetical protein
LYAIGSHREETWGSYPEINDIGLTAVRRNVNSRERLGYSVRVVGGLSTEPHLAVRLPVFLREDQAYSVAKAIVELFREQQDLRENRTRARMKYLFLRHGWTADSFLDAIEHKLGYRLEPFPVEEDRVPDDIFRDHVGITSQKQPGLSAVGAAVLRGRLSGDQLQSLAELADRFGNGELRSTITQNVIIVNVPNARTSELMKALADIDLKVESSPFWRGAIACTPERNSASWLSPKPRPSPGGLSPRWKRGFLPLISRSSFMSPAAPTPVASTGLLTSASKARRSNTTERWSMHFTSASEARSENTHALRGRSAIGPPLTTSLTLSNGCFVAIWILVSQERICVLTSHASTMIACERNLRGKVFLPLKEMFRQRMANVVPMYRIDNHNLRLGTEIFRNQFNHRIDYSAGTMTLLSFPDFLIGLAAGPVQERTAHRSQTSSSQAWPLEFLMRGNVQALPISLRWMTGTLREHSP